MRRHVPSSSRRLGFSLAEALIALSVMGLAGAAMLLATESASMASRDALDQLIANGLANQLVDEIMGLPYKEQGQAFDVWPMGTERGESALPKLRSLYDDSDDFTGYYAQPVQDAWAIELGQGDGRGGVRHANFRIAADYFDDWYVQIGVSYVDESDLSVNLSSSDTSGMRAVEVSVFRVDGKSRREVAKVRRVSSYVPPWGS